VTTPLWLQPLALTRDNQTWTYVLDSGHRFPVSITGLIGKVHKTESQISRIMETKDIWEPRGTTVHLAAENYINSRWNPAHKGQTIWTPTGEEFTPYLDWINPLLAHGFWSRIEVVGSELMVYSTRKNVAGTLDFIFQFADGSYGVGDFKTQSKKGASTYDTKPQLGAAVDMAMEHYGLTFSRCLTVWVRPGQVEIQTHEADDCLSAWLSTYDLYCQYHRPF